jgi:hypothetical protein
MLARYNLKQRQRGPIHRRSVGCSLDHSHFDELGRDSRIELSPREPPQFCRHFVRAQGGAIRSIGQHGVNRIHHHYDSSRQRYFLTGQPIGVTPSVVVLVMVPHGS